MKYSPFWKEERSIWKVDPTPLVPWRNWPFIEWISMVCCPGLAVTMVRRLFVGLG